MVVCKCRKVISLILLFASCDLCDALSLKSIVRPLRLQSHRYYSSFNCEHELWCGLTKFQIWRCFKSWDTGDSLNFVLSGISIYLSIDTQMYMYTTYVYIYVCFFDKFVWKIWLLSLLMPLSLRKSWWIKSSCVRFVIFYLIPWFYITMYFTAVISFDNGDCVLDDWASILASNLANFCFFLVVKYLSMPFSWLYQIYPQWDCLYVFRRLNCTVLFTRSLSAENAYASLNTRFVW